MNRSSFPRGLRAFSFAGLAAAAIVFPAGVATAQGNSIPGLDATLVNTFSLTQRARIGGVVAMSAGVDICNVGSANIDWFPRMNPAHPMYSFMIARESNGRFEQISDRSFVKHGFASINGNVCSPCSNPSGSGNILFPACSDTYGSSLNASRTWLGPPAEIDPWMGAWSSVGSLFDQGLPNVGGAAAMDNQVSPINPPDGLTHRMKVNESDLQQAGTFYYGSYVVVRGEPGTNRNNNFVNRRFTPTFTGTSWNFANASGSVTQPMLANWSGATINSAGNGADDGLFFIGVQVTGPDSQGLYHYEYAVHNRDNGRAGASFRLPKCPSARIENVFFGDIDGNPANDWSVSITDDEIAFLAAPDNALEWNTIYNFAFDSDALPSSALAQIDQARPGAGATTLSVLTEAPAFVGNEYLGDGCGSPAPLLRAFGNPPVGTLPNPSFGIQVQDMSPNTNGVLWASASASSFNFGACEFQVSFPLLGEVGISSDASGVASLPLPLPADPALEGVELYLQAIEFGTTGPLFGQFSVSNGLRVRFGNLMSACPN